MTMILICRFCNWEVSSSYKLQLPSAAPLSPAPHLPGGIPIFLPGGIRSIRGIRSLSLSLSLSQLPSAALSIPSSPSPQLPSAALSIPSSPSPRRHPHFSPRRHQEHQRHQEPLSVSLSLSQLLSYLQQPSLSPTPQVPKSPSPQVPKSPTPPSPQVPSPGGPEAVDAVVPAGPRWCCTSSLVPTLLCSPTGSTGCPLCPTASRVLLPQDRSARLCAPQAC